MGVAVGTGMRTAIVLAFTQFVFVLPSAIARAEWLPILPGAVTRVVATGKNAALVRNQEVLVLREDGRILARIADRDSERQETRDASAKQAAEGTLDRLEIPEIDRGTDYTDDLVDDESRLGQRRAWRAAARGAAPGPTSSGPTLAANDVEIWIGNKQGIFRMGDGNQPVLQFGRAWAAQRMVVGRDRVVVEKGGSLALLSMEDAEPRFVKTASSVGHFSVSSTGKRLAWTLGTEIHIVGTTEDSVTLAPGPIVDLTFCGETLVALLDRGLLAMPPEGRGEMRTAPTNARKLICPAGAAMPWFALAQGLWISADQGQEWTSIAVPSGRTLHDVAVSDHHVWLATSDGLYASVDAAETADLPNAIARESKRLGHARPSRLSWLMPKVSLRAAATFAPAGRQIEGFAFAAFPLGSGSLPVTTVAITNDGPPEAPAESIRSAPAIALRDPDANCLTAARRKAVELAMTEPERARSYVTRAGHAAWLPELRVLVSRRYGRSESLDVNNSSTALSSPLGIDTVNDIRYEARATWDLGRLVFSTEELSAQAQALRMTELRHDIETTMNRLYFERRRLLVSPPRDGQGQRFRSEEVQADLDAMSAGAFGACLAERSTGGQ